MCISDYTSQYTGPYSSHTYTVKHKVKLNLILTANKGHSAVVKQLKDTVNHFLIIVLTVKYWLGTKVKSTQ